VPIRDIEAGNTPDSAYREIYVLYGRNPAVRGEVVRMAEGVVEIRIRLKIEQGEFVSFRLHKCTAKAKVLSCVPDEADYRVSLTVTRDDRRLEPRFFADEPVEVTEISVMPARQMRGRLTDISRSGLGVIVDGCLPIGALIEIQTRKTIVFGEVRHCTRHAETSFRIGISSEKAFIGKLCESKRGISVEPVGSRLWSWLAYQLRFR